MVYKRFVERGRVALIKDGGKHNNKIVSIVDIISQNFVLVDGPTTGVPRQKMNLKQLQLTKLVAKYPARSSAKFIAKTWKNLKVEEKWRKSSWAKNLSAKLKRSQLSDYERFQLKLAKIARNRVKKQKFISLVKEVSAKKEDKKTGKKSGATKTAAAPKPAVATTKPAPAAVPIKKTQKPKPKTLEKKK